MAKQPIRGDRKVLNVDRGLFLVQYRSAEDAASPPEVTVSAAPGYEQFIELITHPDNSDTTLWQPETSLVVRALEKAILNVDVVRTRENGSGAATVRIEPIGQGKPREPSFDLSQIRLLGHVAGIGDVQVGMNEWVAGPMAPSRIEGVAIIWPNKPQGFDVQYAAKSGSGQGTMGQQTGVGTFVGTRGRALPITGLTFEVSGRLQQEYVLAAEAIFLSSPVMRISGKRIVLSGPTGREPLVGLRLMIEPASAMSGQVVGERQLNPEPAQALVPPPPAAAAPSRGRVRVFRSRTKQTGN